MLIPWASWLLAACMGALINASDILEVDLVFPSNETYAPADRFPIVFAFQNPELARYLNPGLSYTLWNLDDFDEGASLYHDLRWVNWTGQTPYFAHEYSSLFNRTGRWQVTWSLSWQSCDENGFKSDPARMVSNTSTLSTFFTTQSSAPKVDLVADTANKTCPGKHGVVIDVTNKTMQVPWYVSWDGGAYTNDTCAVVASSNSTSTPTPDACRVHIDKTVVASMEASLQARLCSGLNPPSDCPEDESAAQRLTVGIISCLLGAFGALGFFLV
ncbi:hypothetical protein N7490_003824 [Penicillium lividum]|nr:hypothetical protein N7490_003824 [Penicillium lividum]